MSHFAIRSSGHSDRHHGMKACRDHAQAAYLTRGYEMISSPRHSPEARMAILITFLAFVATFYPSNAQDWEIECVDCPKKFTDMTDRSLRLDDNGRPHIAYGEDHLYYAWLEGAAWHYETVDESPNVGRYASLALDASGSPHISYYDEPNDYLKHAVKTDTGWQTEAVGRIGAGGRYTSITVDQEGRSHIAYRGNQGLRYVWRDESGWQCQTVDAAGGNFGRTSIAIDSSGNPHISYFSAGSDDLNYALWNHTEWTILVADAEGYVGRFNSLVLDESDHPHISYGRLHQDDPYNSWRLWYAYFDGADWYTERVYGSGDPAYTSIALDSNGNPHVSFTSAPIPGYLKYAFKDGGEWQILAVEDGPYWISFSSLALDDSNHPHISFVNESCAALWYTTWTGTDWLMEPVDQGGEVGYSTNLDIDFAGRPHIVYYGAAVLKYAYDDGSNWCFEVVDTTYTPSYPISSTLDALGNVHVCYLHWAWLWYALRNSDGWQIERINDHSNSGRYSSMAVDLDGNPHISYQGSYSLGYRLAYSYKNETGWHLEIPDSSSTLVHSTSLGLSNSGFPCIGYRSDGHLKFVCKDESGWHNEIVDDEDDTGLYIRLVLDRSGYPHICYVNDFDAWHAELRYARWVGTAWIIEIPPLPTGSPKHISLKLDAADRPHISYWDSHEDVLRYVWFDGSWHNNVVGSEQNVGAYSSLAIDYQGNPCISYQDYANGYLKYAHIPLSGLPTPGGQAVSSTLLSLLGPSPIPGTASLLLTISYPEHVHLSIVDILGRTVRVLHDDLLPTGSHRMWWNGLDERGIRVGNGVYLCSARTRGQRATARLVILR